MLPITLSGHNMVGCQFNKFIAPGDEKWVRHYDESADPMLNHEILLLPANSNGKRVSF
jgi:hypothetical protein